MSIVVHHLERSRSTRVLWMLEELELPYEIQSYARDPKTLRAPPELAAVHPLGRAPVVSVDGHVLAESGAILEYFADRQGALRPTDPADLVDYRFWLHYAEGSVMPPLLVKLITHNVRKGKVPFFVKPVTAKIADTVDGNFTDPAIDTHFSHIDAHLDGRQFFAGDALSMADVQMLYPVMAGLGRGAGERAHAAAWLERMQARPAFQRAIDAGGPVVL